MAERNLNRAEELLNTIKTGAPAERQAAVKELVRAYSPLLSKEYEKFSGTDDKERKTTLLTVFRETFADTSALQSAEVFENSLYANFRKSVDVSGGQNAAQNTFSTTQMVNMVADETDAAQADDEPQIVFGTGKPVTEPVPAMPEVPAENTPAQNDEPKIGLVSEPETVKPAAETAVPVVSPAEERAEPASAETETPAKPKPEKRKPAKKPAESTPEEDEEEGGGLPVWAVAVLGVVAALLLFAVLLLGLRSFAPSAYNGIAGALNSVLPVELPLADAPDAGAAEEPEPAETAEPAEASQPEATAEAAATPEPTAEPTPEPTPAEPAVIGKATVNVDKLNLREEPNTTSAQKGQAERGRTYDVYEISNDGKYTWYRIDDNLWFADDGSWITFEEN